jgi:hypothetical protein
MNQRDCRRLWRRPKTLHPRPVAHPAGPTKPSRCTLQGHCPTDPHQIVGDSQRLATVARACYNHEGFHSGQRHRGSLRKNRGKWSMADHLAQPDADALIAMEKHAADRVVRDYPAPGGTITAPLVSSDGREHFLLDVTRGRIRLLQASHQLRSQKTIILVRLDLEGPRHRNPDGAEIDTPHIHLYREGYDDKWAYTVPSGHFANLGDLFRTLEDFMTYCNVTDPPTIRPRLL